MDLICNDNVQTAVASATATSTVEKNAQSILPTGIPMQFGFGDETIDLTDCTCEIQEEKIADGHIRQLRSFHVADTLTVIMEVQIYNQTTVDYIVYLENPSNENSPILSSIRALYTKMPADGTGNANMQPHYANPVYALGDEQFPVLHLMEGNIGCRYANLAEMAEECRTLRPNDECILTGPSCGGQYSPYFIMERPGGGLTLAIGWSGNWRAAFVHKDGQVTIEAGMERGHFTLLPGEKLRTPRIMATLWEGESANSYNVFRKAYIQYVAPRDENGALIYPPNSCPCPDENGTNGHTELNWVGNVMDDTGAELYWHDAWWHKGGFPAGMGNYTFPIEDCVDHERYPMGVKVLGDTAHEKGYRFMLWFAPESYPPNSSLAKAHPEWMLHEKPDGSGGTLHLGLPEAREYIASYLSACIQEYGVDIFRTDDGFHMNDIIANEAPDREGVLEIQVIDGLYRLWDKLRADNPGLVIDNCCGGGTRLDLELCSRSISLWRTDSSVWYHGQGDLVRHPVLNQNLTMCLNRFGPFTVSGTCDYDPYTVRSGFNGGITLNMDIRNPAFDKQQLRLAYQEAVRLRPYLSGDFYWLLPASLSFDTWCGYQYHLKDENRGCALLFRRDFSPYSTAVVSLQGLDPDRIYSVDFYYDYHKTKTVNYTGRELAALTVTLPGAPESLLLEYQIKPARQYK